MSSSLFVPHHPTLVAIDSDGCAFDTMETKQAGCFFPEMVRYWGLEPVAEVLQETAAFVGLYSVWRGLNRFQAIVKTFELLHSRPEARAAGVPLPRVEAIRSFVHSGAALSNDGLREAVEAGGGPDLARLLAWSEAVDQAVEARARNLPPFPPVAETVARLSEQSDLMVCSQTPTDTLIREWEHHGLRRFVRLIAGPELGTKTHHLTRAITAGYAPDRVLMVGDAPGDLAAARVVGTCFFPIHPGEESASWKRLRDEAYPLFLTGRYRGAYEREREEAFRSLLPETPPWADGKSER